MSFFAMRLKTFFQLQLSGDRIIHLPDNSHRKFQFNSAAISTAWKRR
jgi:hypothetical protein